MRFLISKKYLQLFSLILFSWMVFASETKDTIVLTQQLISPQIQGNSTLAIKAPGTNAITVSINSSPVMVFNGDGTVTLSNLTATTVPYLDSSKHLVSSAATPTQLGYLANATSNLCGINQSCTEINKTFTSPAITTPTGIVKGDVGLGNVDNTSDATKNAATATLANKTLTSPVINSPTGIVKGDVGLGNVDNTSDVTKNAASATLTNKGISGSTNTLTNIPLSAFTNLGTTTQVLHGNASGNPTFSAVALGTDITGTLPIANGGTNNGSLGVVAGSMYYADGSKLLSMGAGTAGQVPVSSGSAVAWGSTQGGLIGDRELISNSNLEANVTGWNAYAGAAGVSPVNGTGGSPNTTCTMDTGTPITGSGSLLITKAGSANRQGEGCSSDVTVGVADRGKDMQVEFDYRAASGTFTPGAVPSTESDIEVYFYDSTNSLLIPVSDKKLYVSSTTAATHYSAILRMASNTAAGRLIFHTATTTTNNFTIDLDNISLHPYKSMNISPITDWVDGGANVITAVTTAPTQVGNTKTIDKLWWRRVGGNMEVRIEFKQTAAGSNTSGSGDYLFAIPAGYAIDTTKITVFGGASVGGNALIPSSNSVGSSYSSVTASGLAISGGVFVYDSTTVRLGGLALGSGTGSGFTAMAASGTVAITNASSVYVASYSVPIVGWTASQAAVRMDQSNFGWTDGGVNTITATTTNPTKGTTSRDKVWYRRNGQNLDVRIEYSQSGAGVAGSGDYLFLIPGSFTADTTVATTFSTIGTVVGNKSNIGLVNASDGTNYGSGVISLYDSTHVRILTGTSSSSAVNPNGSGWFGLNTTTQTYSATYSVPIAGWTENQSAPLLVGSLTSNTSGMERVERAQVSSAGVVSLESGDWINGNCPITSSSVYTCTLNAGMFSGTPVCVISVAQDSPITVATLSTTSSTQVVFRAGYLSSTGGVNVSAFNIICMGPR